MQNNEPVLPRPFTALRILQLDRSHLVEFRHIAVPLVGRLCPLLRELKLMGVNRLCDCDQANCWMPECIRTPSVSEIKSQLVSALAQAFRSETLRKCYLQTRDCRGLWHITKYQCQVYDFRRQDWQMVVLF